jgi:hypothetical protein
MVRIRTSYKIWSENLKGRELSVSRRKWVDNMGIDLREIRWEIVDYMPLVLDRDQWWALFNTIVNLRFPEQLGIS